MWAGLSQHDQLFFKKRRIGERLVAIVVEGETRIRVTVGRQRYRNLREVGVDLAPESRPPFRIDGVQRSVFGAQPILKTCAAELAITAAPALEREFVVDLPADDARRVGKRARHF